ncbi:MAG: hypothetical protein QG599_2869 [Pseudomonadota bacterium]|nr:hypothetical protein [Pseudomonadota bacterium]
MLKAQRLWLKRLLKPIPRWSLVSMVAVLLTLWLVMADPIAQASEAVSVRPAEASLLVPPPAETAAPRRSSILHGITLTDKNAVGPLVKALGLATLVLLLGGAWLSKRIKDDEISAAGAGHATFGLTVSIGLVLMVGLSWELQQRGLMAPNDVALPMAGGTITLLLALSLSTLIAQRLKTQSLIAAGTMALEESQNQFRSILKNAPLGFHLYRLEVNTRLVLISANPAADIILKLRHDNCLGHTLEQILPALVRTGLPKIYRQLAREGGVHRSEPVDYRDPRITGVFEIAAFQTKRGVLAVAFADVTERLRAEQALRQSEERFTNIFLSTPDMMVIWRQHDGLLLDVNPGFETITGYDRAEAMGRPITDLQFWLDPADQARLLNELRASGEVLYRELTFRRRDGVLRPGQFCARPIIINDDPCVLFVMHDITDRKSAEQRIEHLAYYDVLTDLPNRALLNQRAERALGVAARRRTPLAVLFLDMDQFKDVNDSLGHAEGDALLIQVASRLQQQTRETDTACRLGGDEFVLLLPDVDESGALKVANKVLAAFRQPFTLTDHELRVTVSIGIAIFPHDGADFAELLKNADTALYQAKQNGRDTRAFYERTMNDAILERLILEAELRQAVGAGQLRAYYQPKVRLSDGQPMGAEALVRWQHPTRNLMTPDDFIPLAESSDLIVEIGDWMLAEVCRQLAAWRDAGHRPLTVAVNLAARQFRDAGLVTRIQRLLTLYGLPPQALELELTESSLLESGPATADTLQALQALGVGLAIDDFGTGYSNLGYLKRLPLTALKIDQSFVRDLVNDADDRTLAATIVTLGHGLGLKVVAEGVETPEQRRILVEQGCDLAQGYLFGRPAPAEEFGHWLWRETLLNRHGLQVPVWQHNELQPAV